jgi:hypothetical protein
LARDKAVLAQDKAVLARAKADTVGKKTVPIFGCFGKIDLLKNK